LAAQIARINQLTGLNYTLSSDNLQSPESVKSKAKDDNDEEDEEDEEEDNVFFQMMDEYGDDIKVEKMTEEQWKEWEESM
jgi:hypothetical protein